MLVCHETFFHDAIFYTTKSDFQLLAFSFPKIVCNTNQNMNDIFVIYSDSLSILPLNCM